jgi:hypothetical protein
LSTSLLSHKTKKNKRGTAIVGSINQDSEQVYPKLSFDWVTSELKDHKLPNYPKSNLT